MALASGLAAVAVIALAVPDGFQVSGSRHPDACVERFLDADLDRVPDQVDHCPGTSHGFPVTVDGCEMDLDADGVPDGADNCPGTRPGVRGLEEPVGEDGCSVRDRKKERGFPFATDVG